MLESSSTSRAQILEGVDSLTADQKRDLVRRVTEGQSFRRAPAMRAFLLYITEHTLSGRTDKLKEQTIGTEVLGRKPNYDPADDNIVRVRAHELRNRLEKYFATEGMDEPYVITIPRGAYAPEFAPRKQATPEPPEPIVVPAVAAPAIAAVPAPPFTPEVQRRSAFGWLPFTAALLLAIAGSAAVTWYLTRSDANAGSAPPSAAMHDFWAQFFDHPNEDLKIIYADTSFAVWQDLNGKTLDLSDYLNRKFLNTEDDKRYEVASRRVTSQADIASSVRLAAVAEQFAGQVSLQFARDASPEYLRRGNVVLLGSHRSNPWVELYEPNLNFQLAQDPNTGAPMFRNRVPQRGEQPTYSIPAMFDTQKVEEKEFTSYAVIALLQGCGSRGLIVINEGLNTQATQAAGELITDPHLLAAVLQSIGHVSGTKVAPFEALIQITSLPGAYANPKVIAYRLRPAQACVGG